MTTPADTTMCPKRRIYGLPEEYAFSASASSTTIPKTQMTVVVMEYLAYLVSCSSQPVTDALAPIVFSGRRRDCRKLRAGRKTGFHLQRLVVSHAAKFLNRACFGFDG